MTLLRAGAGDSTGPLTEARALILLQRSERLLFSEPRVACPAGESTRWLAWELLNPHHSAEVSLDKSWRHTMHPDALWGQLHSQGLGKSQWGRLLVVLIQHLRRKKKQKKYTASEGRSSCWTSRAVEDKPSLS